MPEEMIEVSKADLEAVLQQNEKMKYFIKRGEAYFTFMNGDGIFTNMGDVPMWKLAGMVPGIIGKFNDPKMKGFTEYSTQLNEFVKTL